MSPPARRGVCVCVPARDEAERLPILLGALAAQDWPETVAVAVALNNTRDGSLDVLERLRPRLRGRVALHVDERDYPPEAAHAGSARRRAMDFGVEILGGDDRAILISTDADARPPADWVRTNVDAIQRGVDLVGGALLLDEQDATPPLVRARWDALAAYWTAVRAIEDAIDPVAWDPPPRHGDHTGGSLAATVAAYRAAGGVPPIATGEDAAFVAAARAAGFRLAHPADVRTRVSSRMEARAQGGMAAKLKALSASDPEAMAVPSLEQWRERAQWRRSVRLLRGDAGVAAEETALPPMRCDVLVAPAVPVAAA